MLVTRLNKRYAKSLLDLAGEMGKLERVRGDIDTIISVIEGSREFKVLLRSPIVPTDKKQGVFKAIFEGKLDELTDKFIHIITQKGREGELEGIAHGFIQLHRALKGIEEAVITSAQPLSEKQRSHLSAELAKITGHQIEVTEKTDPSMIGGIKVRVGDREYNGSIAYQLEQLRRKFADNHYIPEF